MATDVDEGAPMVLTFNIGRACVAAHAADIRSNAFIPVHANNVEPVVHRVVRFCLIVVTTVGLLILHH